MSFQFTFYGHSTFGFQIEGHRLLVDPFFTDNPATQADPDDLEADFILVTHGHGDHVGDAAALAQRTGATVIGSVEVVSWLAKQAEIKTHAQQIGGGYHHPFGYAKMTQAVHGSSLPDGSYGGMPGGFLITTPDDEVIYIAGDTGLFAGMELIGEEGIDLALLPIGDNYTMGPDDALRAVKLLQPRTVIPTHYNTWDLIAQDPAAWKARVEAATDVVVQVVEPDTSLDF
jgi:L-ascorbate metabolism protein UlaG (beta-lactamase superfamily)